jgi:hypothetical protein
MSVQPVGVAGGSDQDATLQRGRSAWLLVIVAAAACVGIALASGTHVIALLITLPLVVAITWQSPRTMVAVLPVWMAMLGIVRRLTPGGRNVTLSGDPILLIAPIVLVILFFVAVNRGALRDRTRLATIVGLFGILALVEAFNPRQGSLLTGLTGLLFILVPMLAFWVGRTLLDEALALQLVKTVAALALAAAIYGLFQQFHGLPSWDRSWINSKGYNALSLGQNVIRAFGTFSSAEEYAAFLSIGLVAWLVLATRSTRMFPPLHLAAIGTVAVALWFESERTAVFLSCLAIGVMAAARLRLPPLGVILGGAGAILLLIFIGGHLGSGGGGSGTAHVLSSHVTKGIAGPFSAGSSLPGHIRATRIGVLEAFKNPLGHGTGSVTLAKGRYSKHTHATGTEFDPGNMGIAFGIFGIIIYAMFGFYAVRTAYRAAVQQRTVVALFGLGMLMATLFQWTNGDLYSVCWLIWLFLGYLDVTLMRSEREAQVQPVVAAATTGWRRPGDPRRGSDELNE